MALSRSLSAAWTVHLVAGSLSPVGCGEPEGDGSGPRSRAAIGSRVRLGVPAEGDPYLRILDERGDAVAELP